MQNFGPRYLGPVIFGAEREGRDSAVLLTWNCSFCSCQTFSLWFLSFQWLKNTKNPKEVTQLIDHSFHWCFRIPLFSVFYFLFLSLALHILIVGVQCSKPNEDIALEFLKLYVGDIQCMMYKPLVTCYVLNIILCCALASWYKLDFIYNWEKTGLQI